MHGETAFVSLFLMILYGLDAEVVDIERDILDWVFNSSVLSFEQEQVDVYNLSHVSFYYTNV